MNPTVAVLPLSDAFADVWPRLITSMGAEYEQVTDPAALAGAPFRAAVLVSAGGREPDSLPAVAALRRGDVPRVAVVGTEAHYAVIRPILMAGADAYFVLPADVGELRSWLMRQVGRCEGSRRSEVRVAERHAAFSGLIGESQGLRDVLEAAALVSGSGASTILITGETGTGKDVLAQAVHRRSTRAGGPFVEVNCAALPANLLEAELFGYEKGAFTDARTAKMGLVEAADGGTLFLDEVGDLPLEVQGKLLRLLETRRSRRLGGIRESAVNTRIVTATHVDLRQRVREGRFREDLYYRLDVLTLTLPPLRERGEDGLLLAEHFAQEFAGMYGVGAAPLSPAVRSAIQGYAWPGNVRQLRNAVERAVILGQGEITVQNLRLERAAGAATGVLPFPARLDEIQASAARAAVVACAGNKSRAADLLGISRKGLYALLREADGGTAP